MKKAEREARKAAQENLLAQFLASQERLQCVPLSANLSEWQCRVNQMVAAALAKKEMYLGRLGACLGCATGREVAARHPEGLEVERRDVHGIPVKFRRPAANQLEKINTASETRTERSAGGDACATGGGDLTALKFRRRKFRLSPWWSRNPGAGGCRSGGTRLPRRCAGRG